MHPPVSAEKKEGMRELRELLPPTFPRIAKIAGVHVTTVREIASKENWPKLHVPRGTIMQVARIKQLEAEKAAQERAEAIRTMQDSADEPPPGDIGALVVGELRAMLAAARAGHIDKARADALMSIMKLAEKYQAGHAGGAPAQEEQKRSDDELAEILERVDRRIVELARAYAERLVAGEFDAAAG